MPVTPAGRVWMDGEFVEWDAATVHVLTPALQYGWAVFEGIRAYATGAGPGVFRLDEHVARLFRSARVYRMEPAHDPAEVADAIRAVVRDTGLDACYIRPLVYRGYGEMGLNPHASPVRVAVAAWPWTGYLGADAEESGVRACVSSWRRSDNNAIPPAAKATGQYLNSALAKMEAVDGGYDEAILLGPHGFVADATGENVFIIRDGRLITPALSDGPLGGITRDSIMTIARDAGVDVREDHVTRADLYLADEAFLTGTAAEVIPLVSVDGRDVGAGKPGPVTRALLDMFHRALAGRDERYSRWLTPVA
jgi:branched-chain amino acid aminotransferase